MKIAALCSLVLLSPAVLAQPLLWQGDMETGDLSQWSYIANPKGVSLVQDCVYQGNYAARIAIDGDEKFLWNGREDLNRSELNYRPENTMEGDNTYFGWSFYLPAILADARHELGYWETQNSWKQHMRFNIEGDVFSFQLSDAPERFWEVPGFATAGVWRDVAMHIHWSSDPEKGFMEVWLDGKSMGKTAMATRYNDTDAMFTQMGILRDRREEQEVIYIDNAREGESIEAVLAGFGAGNPVTCQ
ncbi:MAG TPA: polysaccharide lyase [Cellvibrionaceae bacterium]